MGPSEWSALAGGAILLAYLFGFNRGHKAGEGYQKYFVALEKLKPKSGEEQKGKGNEG